MQVKDLDRSEVQLFCRKSFEISRRGEVTSASEDIYILLKSALAVIATAYVQFRQATGPRIGIDAVPMHTF